MRNLWSAVLLGLLLLSSAAAQQPSFDSAEPPADQLSDEIDVREAEVLLDLPPRLGRTLGLAADDFEVVVGERHLRPVKLERLGRGEAHLAVWFDATGPDPHPVHLAVFTLAQRADVLTGMGAVEVVLADPEPRTVLEPTRVAENLRRALAGVAAEMRLRRRPAYTVRGGGDPEVWERAARWAAASPARGPRFLFLVTRGFLPDPAELDTLGDGAAVAPAPTPRAERVHRAARTLAAAGWVTVPVSLTEAELERRTERPFELMGYDDKPAYGINLVPLIQKLVRKIRGRSTSQPVDDEEEFRFHTAPENVPLVALARETGGEVLGYPTQLDRTLDDLKNRWRLWYRADPLTAEPQALEVIHLGDGRRMRTPRWVAARQ